MENVNNIFGFANPEESPGFLLWQLSNLWQRGINRKLRKYKITHVQFVLLAGIYYFNFKNEEVTQIKLSKHTSTDPMVISNVLRILEKRKLITRLPHPENTRAKLLTLTEEGVKAIKSAVKEVELFDFQFFKKIDDEEAFKNTLKSLLGDNNG